MPKLFKVVGLLLLVVATVGAVAWFANRTYMERYGRMAVAQMRGESQRADWYEPVDKVPGAPDAPLPMAVEPVVDAAAREKARAYAEQTKSQGFVVWQGGALQQADYFGGFQREDLIASKSMAKMVVGIVIGRAIAEGYIKGLDQPVSDFITEWKGTDKEAPTIRQFLQNSSGISRFNYKDFKPWSQTMREYLSEHHEDILINETKLDYPPGSEYDYSMITSDMLGIIVERATGQRYGDYLGNALLKPIGATGGTVYVNRPGGLAHTGCCLMLPAESFVRIGMLMARDGVWDGKRILPVDWVKETVTPSPANPHWGLHMWIGKPCVKRLRWFPERSQDVGVLHSECYLADDLFLFDGSGNQAMWIVPSKDLVVLRFGPPPTKRPGMPGEFDNSILPNTILRGLGMSNTVQTAKPTMEKPA